MEAGAQKRRVTLRQRDHYAEFWLRIWVCAPSVHTRDAWEREREGEGERGEEHERRQTERERERERESSGFRCNHVRRVGYWFRERSPIGSISTTAPARHPRFTSTERVVSKWEHVWDLREWEKARKGGSSGARGGVIKKSQFHQPDKWIRNFLIAGLYIFIFSLPLPPHLPLYFLRLGIYRFVTCARLFIIIADSWVLFRLNGLECAAASLIRADWKI